MKRRILSLLLALCMLAAMIPVSVPQANAAAGYDAEKALAYARAHWNDGKGLCAEFVSRCVIAGGLNIKVNKGTGGCWKAIVKATGIQKQTLKLNSKGYATKEDNGHILSAGDVVVQWCSTHQIAPHILLCGGYDSKGIATFYAHNGAMNNERYNLGKNTAYQHTTACDMGGQVIHISDLSPENIFHVDKTTACYYVVTVPANYKLQCYKTETSTENYKYISARKEAYTIGCTKKLDMSDGTTRYFFRSGDGYDLYFTYTNQMSVEARHDYSASYVDATCTEQGYRVKTCTCGYSYQDNYRDPLGHSWDGGTVTKEPTEEAEGETTFTCTRCQEKRTEPIDKLEHTHKYTTVVTAPTCTEEGFTTYTCPCGHSYQEDFVEALDHSWDGGTVTKEPTEEAEGETTYTCTRCQEKRTESIDKIEHTHQYTTAVTAPTCNEEGFTTYTCACGFTYQDNYVDATGHAWDEGKVTKEPTEEAEGETTYTCTLCQEKRTEPIDKLEHTHRYTTAVTAPTCNEEGFTTYTCACGFTYQDNYVDATGHAWDEGKVTKEPTEEAEGETTYTCTLCQEKRTEPIDKLEHTHKYTSVVIAPTCTEEGYTAYSCPCGFGYEEDYVDALDHAWDEGVVTVAPTEEKMGEKTYTCSRCKETYVEELDALEHTHEYTSQVTPPTCDEEGFTTYTCPCGHSYEDDYVDAVGHIWDEGKVTKEPTEEEEGETLYTCTVCKETRTEAIEVLDHVHKYTAAVTAPTCTTGGYTTHTCACGDSYRDSETPAPGHGYVDGLCQICGEADPDWGLGEPDMELSVLRVAGGHRYETAFKAADQMKLNLGIQKFDAVVVASGTDFADALSGSYLAAVKQAPILLACGVDWVNDLVKEYIRANLNPGGTVYILGGTGAVPASFETGLDGFFVNRLAGDNRFLTNLLVLEEAGIGDKPILVATGVTFADSLSASAAQLPILLVYGNKLLPYQEDFLKANPGRELCIIGGEGAVSAGMAGTLTSYGTVRRVAGGNRFETSVLIAETFFVNPDSAVLAYAWDFPDGLCGGSLAVTMGAPLILTMAKYEAQAANYLQTQPISEAIILGGEKLIPQASVDTIFPRDSLHENELPIG